MKCKNCGTSPAEPYPIECEGGRDIIMPLCRACIGDLNTYGEFRVGKYKDWSEGCEDIFSQDDMGADDSTVEEQMQKMEE